MRNLLLKSVPNLKQLEIQFCTQDYEFGEKIPSPIQLFNNSENVELPKLKVLRCNNRYRIFRGIIENILAAAGNLITFEGTATDSMNETYYPMEKVFVKDNITADLTMLQTLSKLHCLKNLQFCVSEDLIANWKKSMKSVDLKLQSLTLSLELSVFK